MATNYNPEWVYPQPIPGLRLRAPRQIPPPQYVIVGYMPVYPQSRGCDLEALSFSGWLWVIILLIFFFPLAWVPCVMDSCYEPYQVPVYNHPQYTLTQPMAAREMPVGGTSAQPVPAGPGYAAPPPQATEMQAYPPAGWDGAAPTAPTPVPAKKV